MTALRPTTSTPTQRRSNRWLSDAERIEHAREASRKANCEKRKLYTAPPCCPNCGQRISVERDCRFSVTPHSAQVKDVVKVLNARTMRVRIDVR